MTTFVCGAGGFSSVESDPIEAPDASGPNRGSVPIPDETRLPNAHEAHVKCPGIFRDWGWPAKPRLPRSNAARPLWRMAIAMVHLQQLAS